MGTQYHPLCMIRTRQAVLLALVVLLLSLVGCGTVETNVAFYKGQQWKADVVLRLASEEVQSLAMMGGEVGFERELEKRVSDARLQDVKYSWNKERKGSDLIYYTTVEGQGYQKLNQIVFDGQARIQSQPDGAVALTYQPTDGARAYQLSLTGDRIVSGNAQEVRGNTAIWRWNSSSMGRRPQPAQVVLTEANPSLFSSPWLLAAVVVIIILGAVAGLMAFRRRTKTTPTGQPIVTP